MNGDSVLDLVVINHRDGTDGGLTVLLGNGDGSFGPPITTAVAGSDPTSLVLADFNADGRPDAAVTNLDSDTVSVLLNDGTWPPDDPPSVSIRDATVTEGNTGTVERHLHGDPLVRLQRRCDGPLRHGGHHRHGRQRLHGRVRRRDHPGRPDQRDDHGRGQGRPPRRAGRDLRRQPQRRDQCDHRRRPGDRHHPRQRAAHQHQRRDQGGGQERARRRCSRSRSRSRPPTTSR